MAHWAEIDENNVVVQVVVGDNTDPAGDEGYSWLIDNLGGTWLKTSFNTYGGVHLAGGEPLRYNFAGVDSTYDAKNDAFIAPQPFPSWKLNKSTFLWESPIPMPTATDDKTYSWNEETKTWDEHIPVEPPVEGSN